MPNELTDRKNISSGLNEKMLSYYSILELR